MDISKSQQGPRSKGSHWLIFFILAEQNIRRREMMSKVIAEAKEGGEKDK